MTTAALVLAVLALLLAVAARGRAAAAARALEDTRGDARRWTEDAVEALQAELGTVRELLAQVVEGQPPTARMIRDGQLWRDVDPAAAKELVEAEARVIDVRSPAETASGIVPGALLIPIEQLEERRGEIPRDGRPTLVYCAAGGRSAAACEYLSREGYAGLHNLVGGMGAWSGPVQRPEA